MDIQSFRQALTRCGVAQVQARQAIISQGYNNMDLFATRLANDSGVEKFVKTINKLPAGQDGVCVTKDLSLASMDEVQASELEELEPSELPEPSELAPLTA